MESLDNVSLIPAANVYFDGKCVSHTVILADGQRATAGVVLPSRLNFGTEARERMEVVAGSCRVRLEGESEWKQYQAGDTFVVPANSRFDIEVDAPFHYLCYFG